MHNSTVITRLLPFPFTYKVLTHGVKFTGFSKWGKNPTASAIFDNCFDMNIIIISKIFATRSDKRGLIALPISYFESSLLTF